MKKTDTKTDKLSNIIALYAAVALIVAGAAGLLIIKPLYKQIQTDGAKTTTVKAATTALVQLGRDTDTLRINYASVKSQRDQILNQLPVSSEEERLVALLGAMGQANGVVVNSFAPSQGVTTAATATSAVPNGLSVYPASVSITGTYQQIQAFLVSMETSARFISVQASALTGSLTSSTVSGEISFQAYYQQEAK